MENCAVQEINAISQFIHDNPILAVFILVLLFLLCALLIAGIGIPLSRKWIKKYFGSDVQERQLNYDKMNHKILVRIAERSGIKIIKKKRCCCK